MVSARLVRRSLGPDGNVVGSFNHKKMLYKRIYDIMFMDGTVQQLAANRVTISMYKHVGSEGYTNEILDQVQRHCPCKVTHGIYVHMDKGAVLVVPQGSENYFQSPGNIPTRTSQFLQAPRCTYVVLLAKWQGLALRVSKYSWMCLLLFCLFVLQHSTTTPWDSLTVLIPAVFCSRVY